MMTLHRQKYLHSSGDMDIPHSRIGVLDLAGLFRELGMFKVVSLSHIGLENGRTCGEGHVRTDRKNVAKQVVGASEAVPRVFQGPQDQFYDRFDQSWFLNLVRSNEMQKAPTGTNRFGTCGI